MDALASIPKPKCPQCAAQGVEHIVRQEVVRSNQADPFYVIFCASCGHIYGMIAQEIEVTNMYAGG